MLEALAHDKIVIFFMDLFIPKWSFPMNSHEDYIIFISRQAGSYPGISSGSHSFLLVYAQNALMRIAYWDSSMLIRAFLIFEAKLL